MGVCDPCKALSSKERSSKKGGSNSERQDKTCFLKSAALTRDWPRWGCIVDFELWRPILQTVINTLSQLVESQWAGYFHPFMMMPSLMVQWRYQKQG